MANIMLEKAAEAKFSQIPLSSDYQQQNRRHERWDLGSSICRSDFKPNTIQPPTPRDHRRFQSKPACCIRALYERRRDKGRILSCKPLTTTTKSMWRNPWMTSSEKTFFRGIWFLQFVRTNLQPCWDDTGYGALVKSDAAHIIVTHCVLHRYAMATKTLPPKLAEVLKIVVERVNFCTILN